MTDRMDARTADPSAPPPKTLGDYGVEAEKAMENNNTGNVAPIVAEMRAAVPPESEDEKRAKATEREQVRKAPPENLGLAGFADALDAAAQANNVVQARKVAADMIAVEAPTPPQDAPPPAPAPAPDPQPGQVFAGYQDYQGRQP